MLYLFLYEIKESTPYIYSLAKDNIYVVNLYNAAEGGFGFGGVIKVVSNSGSTNVVVPTYTLTSNLSSVDEGGTVTFTVNTQNLATGSALAYSLSGTGISSGLRVRMARGWSARRHGWGAGAH